MTCSTCILNRYKLCSTWDHYPVHAVVEEGEGGRGNVKKKKARKSMDGVARDDEAATEYKRKVLQTQGSEPGVSGTGYKR